MAKFRSVTKKNIVFWWEVHICLLDRTWCVQVILYVRGGLDVYVVWHTHPPRHKRHKDHTHAEKSYSSTLAHAVESPWVRKCFMVRKQPWIHKPATCTNHPSLSNSGCACWMLCILVTMFLSRPALPPSLPPSLPPPYPPFHPAPLSTPNKEKKQWHTIAMIMISSSIPCIIYMGFLSLVDTYSSSC